jgi:hypothetical protein
MSSKSLQLQFYDFLKLLMTCFINFAKFCEAETVPGPNFRMSNKLRSYIRSVEILLK